MRMHSPHPGLSGPHHTPAPRAPRIADLVVYHSHQLGDGPTYDEPAAVHHVVGPPGPEADLALSVFEADGDIRHLEGVPYGPGRRGHWSWPPR